jgi:hypothetical protein
MKLKKTKVFCLFVEAWFLLSLSKLIILFFPFKFIASKIGSPQSETSFENQVSGIVSDIHIAVMRGAKYTFFSSKCYDQALATTFMLKKRKIASTLYFGLHKVDAQLSAHAWVRCGQFIVSGKHGHENFTPVAWFGAHSNS